MIIYTYIYSYVTIFVFRHKSFSCRPESARYKEWMKEMQSTTKYADGAGTSVLSYRQACSSATRLEICTEQSYSTWATEKRCLGRKWGVIARVFQSNVLAKLWQTVGERFTNLMLKFVKFCNTLLSSQHLANIWHHLGIICQTLINFVIIYSIFCRTDCQHFTNVLKLERCRSA